MRQRKAVLFSGLILAVLSCACCPACTPSPSPAPVPPNDGGDSGTGPPPAPAVDAAAPIAIDDASATTTADAGACANACANLASLGCPEGVAPDCVSVCDHTQATKLTDFKPDCLAAAKSQAAAKACGSVSCATH